MKTTKYFSHIRRRPDRAVITDEWIEHVMRHPARTIIQSDGRVKKWGWINEMNKHLRVILLEDGETVHNAFFDRTYKE